MNPLPPLRTVRSGAAAAPALADTPAPAPARPLDPVLGQSRLPAAAKELLQELIDLKLADPPDVRSAVAGLGDRAAGLTTRERAGAALAHAGLLTAYQRDRVVAGSTFGLVLGNYRVLDRLGGGSVGVVFLGEHVLLRRQVAIKVLPVDEDAREDVLDRFHAEMRALAAIDHPHVVAARDAGVLPSPAPYQPALHYLVLELVPGGDVEQYVYDHGYLPAAKACEWGRQAAAGLQAAHDRHLIHRDLKPSNLLLTSLTGRPQVKVVDFGLARQLASNRTRPSALLGSVEFMSPEQALDATTVGPAADVYGLGATLFWTLTGQLPIPRGRSVFDTLQALQTARPKRLRDFRPDLPADLDAFVAKMMARDPAHRPSAVEVMARLAAFAGSDETGLEDTVPDLGSQIVQLRQEVRVWADAARSRADDARRTEDAVLAALAGMASCTDDETAGHHRRMQEYVRLLADRLTPHPDWAVLQDTTFVADLIRCVPVHDIGKVGLPDEVLSKSGPLTAAERAAIAAHVQGGCDLLEGLAKAHGDRLTFLGVARQVVRSHHERWDGNGYPDGLAGEQVPAAARLVALADVYDALRRDRPYRPALSHMVAVQAVLGGSPGQFDPAVLDAFRACETLFDEVFLTIPD